MTRRELVRLGNVAAARLSQAGDETAGAAAALARRFRQPRAATPRGADTSRAPLAAALTTLADWLRQTGNRLSDRCTVLRHGPAGPEEMRDLRNLARDAGRAVTSAVACLEHLRNVCRQ